jgi:hypothetical protein
MEQKIPLSDQGLLKQLTRLVEDDFGKMYPEVVTALKLAWNNDDPELHFVAWKKLRVLGTSNVNSLMFKAKSEVSFSEWISDHLPTEEQPPKLRG